MYFGKQNKLINELFKPERKLSPGREIGDLLGKDIDKLLWPSKKKDNIILNFYKRICYVISKIL